MPERLRDVIRNFTADGFGSLYPRYKGGRPPKFSLPQRREIKKVARSKSADHDLPFSAWSLSKLAEFLVAEGWSTTSAMRAWPGAAAADARDLLPHPGRAAPARRVDLHEDKLYGHVRPRKTRTRFRGFCRYLRSLYPPAIRITTTPTTSDSAASSTGQT